MLKRTGILILMLCLAAGCGTASRTYYIDYAGGTDAADGLTPSTAWKHCPGDSNATGTAGAHVPAPGDIMLFKGGVTYHGSIVMAVSGAPGKPVVLDGNINGTYGEGPAILDGGEIITGWKRCTGADEALGNPKWKEIFHADIDLDIASNFDHGTVVLHRQVPSDRMAPWQRVILIDGTERLLPIAQYPKPVDAFYPDRPRDFLESKFELQADRAENPSVLRCGNELAERPSGYYDGMFLGVHGGNNHTYFARVNKYDRHRFTIPHFKSTRYKTTRYAIYNSPRLIENSGEWSVTPLAGGRVRFHLLAGRLKDGMPDNIGFPVLKTGIQIADAASHITVDGFLIQRFSGGNGGVAVAGGENKPRSRDIAVRNCEIRFLTGHAGIGPNYCDDIDINNNYVHHCPGWTTAVFLSRVNDYRVSGNYLDRNSGSGIRHYECKRGTLAANAVLNHDGMHSTTINAYEGCEDLLIKDNYLHFDLTVNRNARNIVYRNNVLDGIAGQMYHLGIWCSGSAGGRDIEGIVLENNTFVNLAVEKSWETSVLLQKSEGASRPTGVVVRNNILDRLYPDFEGTVENNIFIREGTGSGSVVESDHSVLFRDPADGDYRRKPGGPLMSAGADVAPPAAWQRNR